MLDCPSWLDSAACGLIERSRRLCSAAIPAWGSTRQGWFVPGRTERAYRSDPLEPGRQRWTVTRDLVGYESVLEVVKDLGVVRFPGIDLDVTRRAHERYSCVADDFGSVCGETTWTMGFARDGWTTETITRTVLTSNPTEFSLYAQLDAYEGSERVYADSWRHTIPRDHV